MHLYTPGFANPLRQILTVLDSKNGRNAKASGLAQENHAPDETDKDGKQQRVERPAEYFVEQIGL